MVYFVQAGPGGDIKIGKADNPKKRIAELQCGNPHECVILGTLEGGTAEEKAFHKRFRAERLRPGGEWFAYRNALKRFVDETFPAPTFTESEVINTRRALHRQKLHDQKEAQKSWRIDAVKEAEAALRAGAELLRHAPLLPTADETTAVSNLGVGASRLLLVFSRYGFKFEHVPGCSPRYQITAIRALKGSLYPHLTVIIGALADGFPLPSDPEPETRSLAAVR